MTRKKIEKSISVSFMLSQTRDPGTHPKMYRGKFHHVEHVYLDGIMHL